MPAAPNPTTPSDDSRLARWAFPVLIAVIALFILGGDWGKYLDDWSCSVRDPVTGAADWAQGPWRDYKYFWRPLLMLHWFYLHTSLWNHMWVLHLLGAATHAGVAGLLYALLRRMRLTRTAATAGAMGFLLMPLPADVVFWATAVSISQSLAAVLVITLLAIRYIDGADGRWRLPLMAALGFAAPCLYEQPVMIILMIPLLACAAGVVRSPRGVLRSIIAGVVSGVPMLVYVALLIITAPKTARGGAGSFISGEELPKRLSAVADMVVGLHTVNLRHMVVGGFIRGTEWLASGWGLAAVALAGVLGGVWARAAVRERGVTIAPKPGWAWMDAALVRGACTWAAGVLIWLLAFVPVLPFRGQTVELRNTYVSSVGLAIVLAAIVNLVWRTGAGVPARALRGVMAGAIGVAGVLGAVVMVGQQLNYQSRADLDEQQAAQIAAIALAEPPLPPGTVLVVLDNAKGSSDTGLSLFDHGLAPWSMASWSARGLVHHTLRRTDVEVTHHNPWLGQNRTITDFDADGFRSKIALPNAGTPADEGTRVAWDRALPITVGVDGVVRVVDRLVIEREDGRDIDVVPPLAVARRSASPTLPTTGYVIETNRPAAGLTKLDAWSTSAGPVSPLEMWAHLPFGWTRPAFRIGPYGHAPTPGVISAPLEPGAARVLLSRATLDPAGAQACRSCEPTRVSIEVFEGEHRIAGASVDLDPAQAGDLERWWPIRVEVPAMTRAGRVEIRTALLPGQDGPTAAVLVMPARIGPPATP